MQMGYSVYLDGLLRPLGVYDLDTGAGAAEIYALGQALDEALSELSAAARECVVPTATARGLSQYEELFPFTDPTLSLAERRERIMAFLQTDGASQTAGEISRTLRACGAGVSVRETDAPFTAVVRLPSEIRGIAEPETQWLLCTEMLLPCELQYVVEYNFPTWNEIEALCPTFAQLALHSVGELERYVPVE